MNLSLLVYLGLSTLFALCPEGGDSNAIDVSTKQEVRDPWLAIVEADGNPEATMSCAIASLGSPTVSRSELVPLFRRIGHQRPTNKVSKEANRIADLLAMMVSEDVKHVAIVAGTGGAKTKVIADLIFQLRDQNGHQHGEYGSCDVFFDRRKEHTPASRLAQFGDDAVPQLIAVLDDQRLTRCIEYRKDAPCYSVRVGDCSLAILERISGQKFWNPPQSDSYMVEEGKESEVKEAVRRWWAERQGGAKTQK